MRGELLAFSRAYRRRPQTAIKIHTPRGSRQQSVAADLATVPPAPGAIVGDLPAVQVPQLCLTTEIKFVGYRLIV
jgi:hypothetical protein